MKLKAELTEEIYIVINFRSLILSLLQNNTG
jgi:hypothetical protein